MDNSSEQVIKINVIGLKEEQAKLLKATSTIKKEVAAVIEAGAKEFVRNAKRSAPVNKLQGGGNLRQMISYYPMGGDSLTRTVVSGAKYSPYIEWGTITRVNVPAELQAYAMQFRGRGIKKRGGIFPHPFFFPFVPVVRTWIEPRVKAVLDSL